MRIPVPCLAAALILGVLAGPAESDSPARGGARKPVVQNRLANERSPYLRQHASNPVDWYPWGPAAFQRAKAENKPVFLSVGYAACHWCHVMERESFENPTTARVLNDTFVCVKVDREERPDIDRIYLTAAYALGRPGGWPLSVVLTPDGKPFWAGTYLRPADIAKVAAKIKTDWANDRASIESKADWTTREIQKLSAAPRIADTRLSDRDLVQGVRLKMQSRYDLLNGGVKATKKFPPHAELLFYLDAADRGLTRTELEFVAFTLGKMEEGGIHDQVGGGFHRYAVDVRWFLPHFEKMLYDNALLIRAYARMFRRSGLERFRRVARRALVFVQRDLSLPAGGYASSLDADTNGEEGLTYTWSIPELNGALAGSDPGFISNLMGVRKGGNYFVTKAGGRNNRNVLYLPAPISKFAQANNANPDLVWMRMDAILAKLHQARTQRAQPRRDDKMITAWNGLLLGAMAEAGKIMKDRSVIEQARALGHYIVNNCRRDNGTLLRFPRSSGPEIMGFCEDYAHLIDGLLALADATDDDRYLAYAADLAHRMIKGFEDRENGGFWATSHAGHEKLIARTKSYTDSPMPSDNGTAARVLLLLAKRTGDTAFRDAANRTLAAYRPMMSRPAAALNMIALVAAVQLRDEIETEAMRAQEAANEPALQIRQDVVRVEFFVDGTLDEVLDSVRVRARVTLDGGWHVNTNEPAKAGYVGTVLGAATSSTIQLTGVEYPEPTRKTLMLGEEPLSLYEGTFEILAVVERIGANKAAKPELVLTLQPCSGSTCKEPISIRLPIR